MSETAIYRHYPDPSGTIFPIAGIALQSVDSE